jgi:hypothetical protein
MNLIDLINRKILPVPWAEGEKIPWHEPAFSERMLREHLSQAHDAASRRSELIDGHVNWIHNEVLSGRPTRAPAGIVRLVGYSQSGHIFACARRIGMPASK